MTVSSRLYAPPRTGATRPAGSGPSLGRVLVPICLVVLFERLGGGLLSFAALNTSLSADTPEPTYVLQAVLSFAGTTVGVLAAMFGGDRRAARHVLWVCLGVMLYAGVASMVSPSPWLTAATPAVVAMVSICTTLVAMGYALRAVAIRQSYLIIALLYGMWFVSWLVRQGIRAVVEDLTYVLLVGVSCAGIAIAAALTLVAPGTERQPAEVAESAGAPPPAGTAALVLLLLAAFEGLSTLRFFITTPAGIVLVNLYEYLFEYRELISIALLGLPSVVCFGVLIVAAWRWWRPSILTLVGIGLAAAGTGTLAVVPLPDDFYTGPSPALGVHLLGQLALDLGRHAFYGAAFWVLLRQLVVPARLVFWGAVVSLLHTAVQGLLLLIVYLARDGWTREALGRMLAGASAILMVVIGIAFLLALGRYQLLPLRSGSAR